jgi:hypothetical protein
LIPKRGNNPAGPETKDLMKKENITQSYLFWCVGAAVWCLGIYTWIHINQTFSLRQYDFIQDYYAAKNLLAGESVYTTPEKLFGGELAALSGPRIPNAHPPSSVLWYLPWTALPYSWSFIVWNLVSTILYLGCLAHLLQSVGVSKRFRWLLMGTALVWEPWLSQNMMGQCSAAIFVLLYLAWWYRPVKGGGWSALFIALASTLKLFPAVLCLQFVVRREWRACGVFALFWVLWIVIGFAAGVGISEWATYRAEIIPAQLAQWVDTPDNQSLSGLLGLVPYLRIHPSIRNAVTSFISVGLLGGILLQGLRSKRSADVDRALFLTCSVVALIISPVCWSHYFITLLPGLIWCWARLKDRGETQVEFRMVTTISLLLSWPMFGILMLEPAKVVGADNAWIISLLAKFPCFGLLLFYGYSLWLTGTLGKKKTAELR